MHFNWKKSWCIFSHWIHLITIYANAQNICVVEENCFTGLYKTRWGQCSNITNCRKKNPNPKALFLLALKTGIIFVLYIIEKKFQINTKSKFKKKKKEVKSILKINSAWFLFPFLFFLAVQNCLLS